MFSKVLQQLRKEARLTQSQISEMLHVPKRTYASWERGERQPDLDTLVAIADCFHVSTDYLLGRTFIETAFKGKIQPSSSNDIDRLQNNPSNELRSDSELVQIIREVVRQELDKKGI